MGIEIERKFLAEGAGWRAAAQQVVPMAQGYLNDLALVESGAMEGFAGIGLDRLDEPFQRPPWLGAEAPMPCATTILRWPRGRIRNGARRSAWPWTSRTPTEC